MACFPIVWQKKGQATRFLRMLRQLQVTGQQGYSSEKSSEKTPSGPYAVVLLTFNASAVCTMGRREAAKERESV